MRPTQDTYPLFEANQVLTSGHLNQVFKYLDEQERLTRANLIGIGIVCGLDFRLDAAASTILLDAGCGITSEGYIAVEPDPVALVAYREYELPEEVDYLPFRDQAVDKTPQYRLWELFGADEPKTELLTTRAGFLDDKAVLLFVELKREDLRNCSPSNCDDKGAKVTAKVRRLLITVDDLSEVIARASKLKAGLTFADLEASLSQRLNLPDLHLPRYDVPNTSPVSTQQVYAAFHALFRSRKIALSTQKALTATYEAFKPLVESLYPVDPFAGFGHDFGFLDTLPATTAQVRFLQYYYDFFDDLIHGYTEVRSKGLQLICSCCPPEDLFPRHLMLGVLRPGSVKTPSLFRHTFVASPAVNGCEVRKRELLQLFRRLVEMVKQFRINPPLPAQSKRSLTDVQIRITPSKLGDVEISEKAIPFYYLQSGSPPLFELWNVEKTRWNRANQNLGYRSDEYIPPAPDFVRGALRYDIEPNNFLRVEGHLGKDFKNVLNTLLSLKSLYRLPIEIIALRTGPFDENVAVDFSREECHFQDLRAMHEALRRELVCSIRKTIESLSSKKVDRVIPMVRAEARMKSSVFLSVLPVFEVKPDTIGALLESKRGLAEFGEILDIAEKPLIDAATRTVRLLTQLIDVLDKDLGDLDWGAIETQYKKLAEWTENIKKQLAANDQVGELNWKDLATEIAAVAYLCKLDAVKALWDEYARRVREVKQKQYLSYFLTKNPGIQHKAGVPLGGTFILVYHHDPELVPLKPVLPVGSIGARVANTIQISSAMTRISANPQLAFDPDIRLMLGTLAGQVPEIGFVRPPVDVVDRIIRETVNELADGTVIADFYLPYLCSSDCQPIQYVLPAPKLAFSVQVGCTGPQKTAEVTVTLQGGAPPFSYSLDGGAFQPLAGNPVLASGEHTIVLRDSAGAESSPLAVTVPEPLAIGKETYADDPATQTYKVNFEISGGTTPYDSQAGTVVGNAFSSNPVKSAASIKVVVTDSHGCQVAKEFQHAVSKPCVLPCDGNALRCQYPFWLPEPEPNRELEAYRPALEVFQFIGPDGKTIDLAGQLQIDFSIQELNKDFTSRVGAALKIINGIIAKRVNDPDWFVLGYRKSPKDPFGMLAVEHFACQAFRIRITEMFAYRKRAEKRTVEYSERGTEIRIGDNEPFRLPLFGCEETNKCLPGHTWRARCARTDIALKWRATVEGNVATLVAAPSAETETPVQYLWEVEDGAPSLLVGTNLQTKIMSAAPPTKQVRLTAFSQKGCIVTFSTSIKMG